MTAYYGTIEVEMRGYIQALREEAVTAGHSGDKGKILKERSNGLIGSLLSVLYEARGEKAPVSNGSYGVNHKILWLMATSGISLKKWNVQN